MPSDQLLPVGEDERYGRPALPEVEHRLSHAPPTGRQQEAVEADRLIAFVVQMLVDDEVSVSVDAVDDLHRDISQPDFDCTIDAELIAATCGDVEVDTYRLRTAGGVGAEGDAHRIALGVSAEKLEASPVVVGFPLWWKDELQLATDAAGERVLEVIRSNLLPPKQAVQPFPVELERQSPLGDRQVDASDEDRRRRYRDLLLDEAIPSKRFRRSRPPPKIVDDDVLSEKQNLASRPVGPRYQDRLSIPLENVIGTSTWELKTSQKTSLPQRRAVVTHGTNSSVG